MSTALAVESSTRNPFRNAAAKPQWAQLTRLGGDRVAILFEDLRKQISGINGLVEELHFNGPEEGWLPRYRVGDQVLLRVQVLPGCLTAMVELDEGLAKNLLNSPGEPGRIKAWLRPIAICEGIALLRARLSSRAHTRSLTKLLLKVHKGYV
jgi:hypothetical protein